MSETVSTRPIQYVPSGAEVEAALVAGLEACGVDVEEVGDANRDTNRRFVRAALVAARAIDANLRKDVAEALTEHRYLCGSDRGVSPRWEQCVCGERFTTTPGIPAWRLLAEHQAERIASISRRPGDQ